MSRLRIAMCVGMFPVISETFILAQMAGLLKAGHSLSIYADLRGDLAGPLQPELRRWQLLDLTTFMDMPQECAPWELPIRPLLGKTWVPGREKPVRNLARVCHVVPAFLRVAAKAPRLLPSLLSSAEHSYAAASCSALYRAAVLVRQRSPDILHAHFGLVGNHYRFARQLWNCPFIVSFYGYDFASVPRTHGSSVYNKLFATADRIIGISGHACAELGRLGCPADKLRQLPLGLRLDEFRFQERRLDPAGPVRLLTIGRLVEKKGIEYSIRAVAQLREKFPHVHYDIVGDGPLRPQLTRLVADLQLEPCITFHGARDKAYIQDLLAKAHLFLLASVTAANGDQEGQGVVLLEAQACGIPVVATRHGPFPEVVAEDGSALLVPERDPEALAHALRILVSKPERWPEMGHCGRRIVEEKFDQTKLDRELIEIYQETVGKYRDPQMRTPVKTS